MTSFVLVVLGVTVFGPELPHCRLGEPVFVSDRMGFVGDACGKFFITRDSAQSWSETKGPSGHWLERGIALSNGSVLVAGDLPARMFVSSSLGEKWSEVRLPDGQMLYALTARGPNVWACGSSGKILHSADFGKTWSATSTTPTNDDDRSISLDFTEGSHGWIAGWYGNLWKTDNGGESWQALRLPAEFKPKKPEHRALDRVLLVDERIGFIYSFEAGTWRTRDGGKSWEMLSIPARAAMRVREFPGGRRVLVTAESAQRPLDEWNIDLSVDLRPFGAGAVSDWRDELTLWLDDGTKLVTGLAGPRSGEVPNPDSVRVVTPNLWTAVGTYSAFFSQNRGASWRELAPLPGKLVMEKFVMFEDLRALARSGDKVFRYENHEWTASLSALDARDLSVSLDESAEDPTACLAEPSGRVALRFDVHGCFGGSTQALDLAWTPKSGALNGRTARKLDAKQIREALEDLKARALQPELQSGCRSTNKLVTSMTVSCTLNRREVSQTLVFETHDCEDDWMEEVGASTTSGGQRSGYARAIGLRDWARKWDGALKD